MKLTRRPPCLSLTVLPILIVVWLEQLPESVAGADPPPELVRHLTAIAELAHASPTVRIAEGWFIMGSFRKDDDPFGLETQYDDTELPQRRIWLDAYGIDRDEVSLAEYLFYLHQQHYEPPDELQRLIWHVITVHALPDYVLASWPALYVTWREAAGYCQAQGKRLPTEAEWEKAARGQEGNLFPWGNARPEPGLAVFGQYHVHEIPLVAAVNGGEEGRSPYGLRHMAGNIAEWVQDWFGFDYHAVMPERNPPGPTNGRYKSVRGGPGRANPTCCGLRHAVALPRSNTLPPSASAAPNPPHNPARILPAPYPRRPLALEPRPLRSK